MKKGQIVEGIIERVDFPNKGIVKVEGEEKILIVKNAIPGQKVMARVSLSKMRSWDRKYQRRSIRSEKENVRDACSRCWKNLHWNCRNRDVFIMVSAAAVHSRAFRMKNSFP